MKSHNKVGKIARKKRGLDLLTLAFATGVNCIYDH